MTVSNNQPSPNKLLPLLGPNPNQMGNYASTAALNADAAAGLLPAGIVSTYQTPDGLFTYPGSGTTVTIIGSGTGTTAKSASFAVSASDNGKTYDITANATLTFNVNTIGTDFNLVLIPSSGVTITFASDGTFLLNGATTSLTRTAASNISVAVVSRSAANSVIVTGA